VAEGVTFTGGTAIHRARLLEEMENQNYNSGMVGNDMLDYYELLASNGDVQTLVSSHLNDVSFQGRIDFFIFFLLADGARSAALSRRPRGRKRFNEGGGVLHESSREWKRCCDRVSRHGKC